MAEHTITLSAAQAEMLAKLKARETRAAADYQLAVSIAIAGHLDVPDGSQVRAVQGATVVLTTPDDSSVTAGAP